MSANRFDEKRDFDFSLWLIVDRRDIESIMFAGYCLRIVLHERMDARRAATMQTIIRETIASRENLVKIPNDWQSL